MNDDDKTQMIPVLNPRSGAVDYHIERTSRDAIETLSQELKDAQTEWAALTIQQRVEILLSWADELEAARSDISAALMLDTGRRRIAQEAPGQVIGSIRGWTENAPKAIQTAAGRSSVMPAVTFTNQYKPYPLLGVISPWNFPMVLSLIDAIPALLAGCSAIIKPSEITPRFVEPLAETIRRIEPLHKILRYITGDGETGAALVDNVDIVCFTGSVATGRRVAESAARNFIPAFLELGGKDPVIITAGADLDRASTAVLRGSVYATGQICFSLERVYVDRQVHDDFVERLVNKAEELEVNYPDIDRGHIGPMIDLRQADIIQDHIDDARAKGAEVKTGGEVEDHGGKWIRPTVLTGVDHTMKIMTEETFGPVMPVMAYDSEDEAIRLANDTIYGLSAAVLAGDTEEGERIASQIDAGAVSVMDTILTGAIIRDAEKTSFKQSGLGGTRMGPGSILRFFRKKAILTNSGDSIPMTTLGETG
jgi:succinate-semialdehyde dehydrogenase/glutarate-semialdehyde dehydrogenase